MHLAAVAYGRDNNFNLLRIIAAMAVLVSHSFALAIGSPAAEPWRAAFGITPGTVAVDIFFTASGFLVTASLLRTASVLDFTWARVLRIFPGLIVMMLLVVLGLGLYFTTWSWSDYLQSRQTQIYFAKGITLLRGVNYVLPGVFESNPQKQAVNGSLWTMPHEVRMYAVLAAIWTCAGLWRRHRQRVFEFAVIASAVFSGLLVFYVRFSEGGEHLALGLFFMFFTGASFFVLRKRVVLSSYAFWALVAAVVAGAVMSRSAFFVAYTLGLAYAMFYVVYVPAGFVRQYNRLGDYSYGVYIYAFPVQQSVVALIPSVSVTSLLSLSAIVTLGLAALSWHLLESRALAMKPRAVLRTRSMFGRANA